jgi:hypothetical protein
MHPGLEAHVETTVSGLREEAVLDGQSDSVSLDLTRYLCAATYLDPGYAKSLVEHVSGEPHLAVAPSPACDIPVVLRHAYAADARRHRRDLILAPLLVFLVAVLLVLLAAPVVGHPSPVMPLVSLISLLLLAWATVFTYEASTLFGDRLRSLRAENFDPATAPSVADEDAARRIREVGEYAAGNLRVYSGYWPFTGYGNHLRSWSFTLDVTKPAVPGVPPVPFDVADLYSRATGRVKRLGLPAVRVEELLFVDGRYIIDDNRFLSRPLGRPAVRVAPELIDELKRAAEDKARPYLAVLSAGWGGDLVASMFVRFARHESVLFVEAVHTVLPPLHDGYKVIDWNPVVPSPRRMASLLFRSLVLTVRHWPASPGGALRYFWPEFGVGKRLRRQKRMITELRWFDYGARIGVRQQAADSGYHRHFEAQDNQMVKQAADRSVLDMLIEFAEEHGIDVEELKRSEETIFNYGIIAGSGAQVTDSAVASGERSGITLAHPRIPAASAEVS